MSATLKLYVKEPLGERWQNNIVAAVNAADVYNVEIVRIPKSKAGDNVKVPSVYLDDKMLAEIGGLRDGIIEEEDLMNELERANVSRKQGKVGG